MSIDQLEYTPQHYQMVFETVRYVEKEHISVDSLKKYGISTSDINKLKKVGIVTVAVSETGGKTFISK